MYISVDMLQEDMGVDRNIARFFVDRKIPADNAFWRKRLLYIGRGNGYVSIPVFYDGLFRVGVPLDCLLAEDHVRLMERVMHFAMQYEFHEISFQEQLAQIKNLFVERASNPLFFAELIQYLEQPVLRPIDHLGLPQPSLNRADVFLFVLADLPMSPEQTDRALQYWYALHPTYLIMDDMMDYDKDKKDGEENVILDLGDGAAGFTKGFALLDKNIRTLETFNATLADYLDSRLPELKQLHSTYLHGA